jgi:hypothetical protein
MQDLLNIEYPFGTTKHNYFICVFSAISRATHAKRCKIQNLNFSELSILSNCMTFREII